MKNSIIGFFKVFFIAFQVTGQMFDPFSENSNLYFRGTGVGYCFTVFFRELFFGFD